MSAIGMIKGGQQTFGIIGLQSITLNGKVTIDSYNATTETYPGVGGSNSGGSLASNGNITLNGSVTISGDVRPGIDHSIQPNPLGDNVDVTGWMGPLDTTLVAPANSYSPPAVNNNGEINPQASLSGGGLDVKSSGQTTVFPPGDYVLAGWQQKNKTATKITGPARIFINGDLSMGAQSTMTINSVAGKVQFFVNGNFDAHGGTVTNSSTPANLTISLTKANTSVDLGGGANLYAHINAPLSDVKLHGNPGYFGWLIGKTLTLDGTSDLHYDETLPQTSFVPYTVSLVK
jgi:hypothetical protein